MDPISTVASAAAALSAAMNAGKMLSGAITDLKAVDDRVLQLQKEVGALIGILDLLHRKFQETNLKSDALDSQTGQMGEYQRNIRVSLDVCQGPLRRLEALVCRIKGSSQSRWTQPVRAFKMNFVSGEIAALRQDVHIALSAISIALQMIPV
jgi:hypothetical protein